MAYVDKELTLMSGQDLGQAAATYYSDYCINLGSVLGDPGAGQPLWIVIHVDEAFTSAGSATVQFHILDEADTTIDSGSVVIQSTRAHAYTDFTLGKVIAMALPMGIITQQYIGLSCTIGTATTTAGTVTAYMSRDLPSNFGDI